MFKAYKFRLLDNALKINPQHEYVEGVEVRMKGLEPPCLAALDPKSSASTNFATSAGLSIVLQRY